ncbi:putative S-adenosylmethionine mitochondrial carrier protein [Cladorrhinum sp. PSN259]|nr:putative S-adenosylmethionine mitochondrial carrier protein [Cladorrhinum sp. PSN259]
MRDSTQKEIMAAGAIAAFTVDLLVYPLDTLKTRIQSQDFSKVAKETVKRSGSQNLKGLYQGIGSVIFATLPAAGIFFMTYESAKSALRNSALPLSKIPQPAIHSLASAAAELASCAILTPAEVIKQNAQVLQRSSSTTSGNQNRSSSLEALHMVLRSEGGAWRRLWSGYTALAARNLPFTALQFPMFEFFRGQSWIWRRDGTSQTGSKTGNVPAKVGPSLVETGLITGVSAAVSGSLASLITTPMDVIKTRMMLRDDNVGGWGVAKLVVQERGIRGLFRGAVLRVSWTALGSGLYLGSYETAKVWLKGGSSADEEQGDGI